jgi:riboflavin kinase/FMN adenylyltransferase
MEILHGLDGLAKLPRDSVLSIGNFDGIHLGHQSLLHTAKSLVENSSAAAMAVVTFEPHPLTVLRPRLAPPRLTPPPVKQPLIASAGADYLVILPPQPQVLGMSAAAFWEMLRDQVQPAHLVEGAAFRFGKGAAGTVQKLATWCADSPVKLHIVDSVRVPLLDLQLAAVSSSLIRFLISFGRVRDAAICLGRPYLLRGQVIKGFARGRELGFPTANVQVEDQFIPADAVYAARCTVDGRTYPAALSIGTNPTFGDGAVQVEAHLINFTGDLYGQTLNVELLDWLRDQRKFTSIEPLKKQIARDIATTERLAGRDVSRPIAAG